jgi:hypothetical protein
MVALAALCCKVVARAIQAFKISQTLIKSMLGYELGFFEACTMQPVDRTESFQ